MNRAQVVVDPPPFAHRPDDGGEVVVEEDHRAGFLRHVGPGDAHGHADVGSLERGRIVHAVAGHGDELALLLKRRDDSQLLLGRDAGVHAHPLHALLESLGRELASSAPVMTAVSSPSRIPSRRAMARAVKGGRR